MFAEAENELNGPTDECIKALNRVRERSNARTLLQGEAGRTDNKENMRQLLFREQTRELCFEVPRHMELRRRGSISTAYVCSTTKPLPRTPIAVLPAPQWAMSVATYVPFRPTIYPSVICICPYRSAS